MKAGFAIVFPFAFILPAFAQETPPPAPEITLANEDLHAYGLDWPLRPAPAVQTRGGRDVDLIHNPSHLAL